MKFQIKKIVLNTILLLGVATSAFSQKKDSLPYPLQDRRGDAMVWNNNNIFNHSDTSLIERKVTYDPKTNQFLLIETIGGKQYRQPTVLTFDEFKKLQAQEDETNYYQKRADALDLLNYKQKRPKLKIADDFFNRTFGKTQNGNLVDILPQGELNLSMGYQGQYVNNPTLSETSRHSGGFDLNMNANVNVMANIGDKLTLPISYNTQANFNFENQLKLRYNGKDDEILRSIEAGNISFQTKSTLMTSFQNLFGVKTSLQFGRLGIMAAIGTVNSQKQSLTLQNGGVSQTIDLPLDDYAENNSFLLGQYFHDHYNYFMGALPLTRSQVRITRMEVWVTNRNSDVNDARVIVGLADLGESKPHNTNLHSSSLLSQLPSNDANNLYDQISNNASMRSSSIVQTLLQSDGLQPITDFEKIYARKLASTEYSFNPEIGFLTLNTQLQSDDVLGVAYQYTYNGKVYQVGEFSNQVALDSTTGIQKVLFVKLLKATAPKTNLPIWNLMMKNVYNLNVSGIDSANFKLSLYYKDPSGGTKRYLPESSQAASGQSILTLLNADRVNSRQDPQPDGQYDFFRNYTVLPDQGKIIFPLLEPFGKDLDSLGYAGVDPSISAKYVYYPLYDSLKAIAQTYANLDRFVMTGYVKGTSTSTISLGAMNIPQGSVSVTAGGTQLVENQDYVVDYNLGTIQIINAAYLNTGVPLNVQYENNTGTTSQQRTFKGMRLDYMASDKLVLGATMEKLSEQPYYTRSTYGNDPIDNTMYGFDLNYRSELPGVTSFLNKLPNYHSDAMSNINAYGEIATLKPGHSSLIGTGNNGYVYIDDFEGANGEYDLRYPFTSWALASTPSGTSAFPEASLKDSLPYGYNRAKLAWYNIESVLQDATNSNNPLRNNKDLLSDSRVRAVYTKELFPQQSNVTTNQQTTTFDMAFYPKEIGPYNYVTSNSEIDANGHFKDPKSKWGGIMRSLNQTDFQTNNIEYIEFWVQDPFVKNSGSTGGKLIFNLGNVSEDILKDGKHFYENGLNAPNQQSVNDSSSVWGVTPLNPIQVTNAFSNNSEDRVYQDVGLDGMNDDQERNHRSYFLQILANNFGTSSKVYQDALSDPSRDNYKWYRSTDFTSSNGILERYKNFNNTQGNSPVSTSTGQSAAETMYPDNEDLNQDNTINETEAYFQYDVNLTPSMQVGNNYIVDERTVTPKLANGTTGSEKWYLFRVPIDKYTSKIGDISDFKSIRFIRMYMTDFQDTTVLRFARLALVRNQWRNFTYQIDTTGNYNSITSSDPSSLTVSSVNLEDNSAKSPIPYKMPPGIERLTSLTTSGVNILSNEQSLSLDVSNLQQGKARGIFKSMDLDMRQYGQLSMFIHAESITGQTAVQDNQLQAVIRIGQDYINNYYQIAIPLKITAPSMTASAEQIWPTSNELQLALQDLVDLKLERNSMSASATTLYSKTQTNGQQISVMGNPNLAEVYGFLISVKNNTSTMPLNAEVWLDELRMNQLDEKGGWASSGRVDMQLADLGSLSVSSQTYSIGWGSIDQNVNARAKNSMRQIDGSINIDAGKLLPQKWGASVPVFASYNKTVLTPEFDPYDQDVKLAVKLAMAKTKAEKDSIRRVALDQSTTTMINFSNVHFGRNNGRPKLWSLSNFALSYSFMNIRQSSPIVTANNISRTQASFAYNFNGQGKFWYPFKRKIRNESHWLDPIRDFNINFTPSLLSFRATIDRQFGLYIPRSINSYGSTFEVEKTDTTYDKYFQFNRYYNMRWQLTQSLNLDFSAVNYARVDEPDGLLNTKAKKDSMWHNFWKGGRTTLYTQNSTLTYALPLQKFPMLDWIQAQYSYTTNYNWIGASLLTKELGNTIENGAQNNWNAEFDFSKLYDKSRFLRLANKQKTPSGNAMNAIRNLNNPNAQQQQKAQKELDEKDKIANLYAHGVSKATIDTANMIAPIRDSVVHNLKGLEKRLALRKWRKLKRAIRRAQRMVKNAEKSEDINGFARTGGQILSMIKQVSINYNTSYNSRIPGFMDSTQMLGNNFKTGNPGLGYVFGKQPTQAWINKLASEGYITKDSLFNDVYRQTYTQQYTYTAQVMPIPDLSINLTMQKQFSKDQSSLFKYSNTDNQFENLSPYASGGFSVSYISFKTMFNDKSTGSSTNIFDKFSQYRQTISQRLGAANPYSSATAGSSRYAKGYNQYAQDVLIPSFIAAYTGKSPNTVALVQDYNNGKVTQNPFGGYKALPNWNLNYTGLTKIPFIHSLFSNFNISHAYSGTLSMNSFTSSLDYADPYHYNMPGFIDSASGNYVPYYIVPNITIQEQFAPLIGFDVTTNSQSNIRFQYSKSRTVSLSITNYQVSEVNSTQFSLGGSLRKRNVYLPFIPGSQRNSDMNITLDLAFQNSRQNNSVLDQSSSYSIGGQKVISISPAIDYIINDRVNLKFYYDQQKIIPYVSTTSPVTTTRAGIQIRVSLAPPSKQRNKNNSF